MTSLTLNTNLSQGFGVFWSVFAIYSAYLKWFRFCFSSLGLSVSSLSPFILCVRFVFCFSELLFPPFLNKSSYSLTLWFFPSYIFFFMRTTIFPIYRVFTSALQMSVKHTQPLWAIVGFLSVCLCGFSLGTLVYTHSPKPCTLTRTETLNRPWLRMTAYVCVYGGVISIMLAIPTPKTQLEAVNKKRWT